MSSRLKDERTRLGLTHQEFADICGASKRAAIGWEKGVSAPNMVYLEKMAEAGVDVNFVVTGNRVSSLGEPVVTNKRTAELVKLYEQATPAMQLAVLNLLKAR